MFKTKKFIVFFVAALMGIALCQAAASKKAVKAKKPVKAKTVKTVKKVTKPKPGAYKSQPSNYNDEITDCSCNKKAAVGIAFVCPLQTPCEKTMITGFRFAALYAYNEGVDGLDCGFVCDSGAGGTNGIQASFFNRTAGTVNGLSLALFNVARTRMTGLQIGGIYNELGSDSQDNAGANFENSYGAQIGVANVSNSIFAGFQLGAFNIANSIFKGFQIGVINLYEPPSDVFDDFETAEFIEAKKKRSCIQIGVLNFNPKGLCPITILFNW